MRIGLIGYGKMGQAIEAIALERGHTIAFKVNSQNPLSEVDFASADVAIEFSQPHLAPAHIKLCVENNLPVVVGTTAWQKEHLEEITDLNTKHNGSVLHASNFSIGVNIVFKMNEELAKWMKPYSEYKPSIEEIHHLQKLDAPSGTAVSLAEGIIASNDRYAAWKADEKIMHEMKSNELGILAKREPDVPGTHYVRWTSEIDTITLTHEAHNRKGFALGAVVAAEFLHNKTGLFTMRDVLEF